MAGDAGLYAPLVGWFSVVGIMYASSVSHAWLNGSQSPVIWPYDVSSHSQKLYASDVVSWP